MSFPLSPLTGVKRVSASYPDNGTDDTSSRYPSRTPLWPALAMVASWILGILWIVVYYVNPNLPLLSELGNWNLLIGFMLLILGVVFALVQTVVAIASARRRP
ncbi:cell division protein CrgA [Nonomuraea sp. NPDC050478]|uniref:cell division protein CrgA n=1 Tax=Nonomuraea sp. NPDC050478 TaxID=3364365 RepID=UPI0037B1413F